MFKSEYIYNLIRGAEQDKINIFNSIKLLLKDEQLDDLDFEVACIESKNVAVGTLLNKYNEAKAYHRELLGRKVVFIDESSCGADFTSEYVIHNPEDSKKVSPKQTMIDLFLNGKDSKSRFCCYVLEDASLNIKMLGIVSMPNIESVVAMIDDGFDDNLNYLHLDGLRIGNYCRTNDLKEIEWLLD